MKACKHTTDGYCIRPEKDYCNSNECKGCDHIDKITVVLNSTINCETTALRCTNCGEILTEPKTDCR